MRSVSKALTAAMCLATTADRSVVTLGKVGILSIGRKVTVRRG
jgi:hypothetical protein